MNPESPIIKDGIHCGEYITKEFYDKLDDQLANLKTLLAIREERITDLEDELDTMRHS